MPCSAVCWSCSPMGWPSSRHGQGVVGVVWQGHDVGLWLLFTPPRTWRCREVVVRTRNDSSWSDLETFLEEEAPKVRATQACQWRVGSCCPVPCTPAQSLALAPSTPPHLSWIRSFHVPGSPCPDPGSSD
ncbi:hypothetical protein P7K49_040245 [Saguinus oedipus]|uniref:Uncharacterized protein n=1 Tax=Saguinus oedipus TaxID=9490 RepID=A0ABQ9T9B1_SAGOE|nr:hypothetical protein P7K49_040245 [Saguinus oedipus]